MTGRNNVTIIYMNEVREHRRDDTLRTWEQIKDGVISYVDRTEKPAKLVECEFDELIGPPLDYMYTGRIKLREGFGSMQIGIAFRYCWDGDAIGHKRIEVNAGGIGYECLHDYSLGLANALSEESRIPVFAFLRKPEQ